MDELYTHEQLARVVRFLQTENDLLKAKVKLLEQTIIGYKRSAKRKKDQAAKGLS